jgi:hypothetical protein
MNAEIGAICTKFFGGYSKVDRLQKSVGSRACLRLRGGRPMPERQKSDLFHDGLQNVGEIPVTPASLLPVI